MDFRRESGEDKTAELTKGRLSCFVCMLFFCFKIKLKRLIIFLNDGKRVACLHQQSAGVEFFLPIDPILQRGIESFQTEFMEWRSRPDVIKNNGYKGFSSVCRHMLPGCKQFVIEGIGQPVVVAPGDQVIV